MNKHAFRMLGTALLSIAASAAAAHDGVTHSQTKAGTPISADEHAFGRQGDPKNITRIIAIDMRDTMRFGPADITVRQGETIKFVVKNQGKMMHEMVIGTLDELKAHGELMKQHPGMEHDEPYMAHVVPGKKEEMIWQFTQAGEFYYACLVPGHAEAGMIGKINVKKGQQ